MSRRFFYYKGDWLPTAVEHEQLVTCAACDDRIKLSQTRVTTRGQYVSYLGQDTQLRLLCLTCLEAIKVMDALVGDIEDGNGPEDAA